MAENNTQQESNETRLYEIGYLFVPSLTEEEASKVVDTIKELVEDHDGKVHAEGGPEYIDLAYSIEYAVDEVKQEFRNAYFGWIQFETDGQSAEDIQETLRQNDDIIRILCMKIDSDEIGAPAQPGDKKAEQEAQDAQEAKEMSDDEAESKSGKDSEEIDEEEIDDAIDELVAE